MRQALSLRCMPIDIKCGQAAVMQEIMAAKAARLRLEIIFQISISFERKP